MYPSQKRKGIIIFSSLTILPGNNNYAPHKPTSIVRAVLVRGPTPDHLNCITITYFQVPSRCIRVPNIEKDLLNPAFTRLKRKLNTFRWGVNRAYSL